MSPSHTAIRISLLGLSLMLVSCTISEEHREPLRRPSTDASRIPLMSSRATWEYQPPPPEMLNSMRVIGHASRSGGSGELSLVVIAPDHAGLTIQEQPTLYWYLAQETNYPIEVTLIDAESPTPLLEARMPTPMQPGLHRVRLSDYDVYLEPDMLYEWFVAIRLDRSRRSRDIITSGGIRRIIPSAEMRAVLAQASQPNLPRLYAQASLWYDAISALSDLIEASPQASVLRQQRASLLAQVGLLEPAVHDKQL